MDRQLRAVLQPVEQHVAYQDAGGTVLLGYFGGSFDNVTGAYLVSPYL